MDINNILLEWSYRLKKGYPTMKDGMFTDPSELKVLHEILKENGIKEIPSFAKSKTPVSDDVTRAINEAKTAKDIQQLISKMKLRDDQISKLYDIVKTFTIYEPIKNTLLKKSQGYDDLSDKKKATKQKIYKEFTNKLKNILEKISGSSLVKFQKYLQDRLDGSAQDVNFPDKDGRGEFQFPDEVGKEIGDAIAAHTGQDEQKKGVGQGELMMTLVYDNISQPAGKGDVYLEGAGELEVKGFNAVLGNGKPADFPLDTSFLKDYGFPDGWPAGKMNFAKNLIEIYSKQDEEGKARFLEVFKDALKANKLYQGGESLVDEYIIPEAFDNVGVLSKRVGILNFYKYHSQEEFACFIACDYGSGSGAGNSGLYVFAKGSVQAMAKTILTTPEAQFQAIGANNIKPRIRVASGNVSEIVEEELNY